MEDVTKSAYAEWLEEFIKDIMEYQPERIGVCMLLPNGGTYSNYFGDCGHLDKALMGYTMNLDAIGYEKGLAEGKREAEKRGRWIIHHEAGGRHSLTRTWAECSECHVCGSPQWKVCPVCETKMENHTPINIEGLPEVYFDYAAEDDNA